MLNQFDLAFIVDTTASMGSFIDAARREMKDMLNGLAGRHGIDMRVGIVEYRDHPPQDHSFVQKTHAFSDDMTKVQATITKLSPNGGGDWPEAVFDGVVAACKKLKWRDHARRIAVLLGDAPPHGHSGDRGGWDQCPCGETMDTVSSLVEETCIRLFSVPLNMDPALINSFKELALLTGGGSYPVGAGSCAIDEIRKIVDEEFGNLELDTKVHKAWHETNGEITPDDLAEKLDVPMDAIYDSLGRLGVRNLLEVGEAVA